MKGQSEILVFVLLFLLSIALFITAIFWSRGIVQNSVDIARVSSAERTARNIDSAIKNVILFDGYEEVDYGVEGPITLLNDNTLEIRAAISSEMSLPRTWSNISVDSSVIREVQEADIFRIQIWYPQGDNRIELFTDSSTLAKPPAVRVEKNETLIENGRQTIKIRITFV